MWVPFETMRLSFVYNKLENYFLVRDCMALKVNDNEFRIWVNIREIVGDLPSSDTIGAGFISSEVFEEEFCFKTIQYRASSQRDCLIFRCYRDN